MPNPTPASLRADLSAFQKKVGKKASISCGLTFYDAPPICVYLYPWGLASSQKLRGLSIPDYISISCDLWEEVLPALESKWQEVYGHFEQARTRQLAFHIIEITALKGHCTTAALCAEDFTHEEIEQLESEAIALANEMASNGPFSIEKTPHTNAP